MDLDVATLGSIVSTIVGAIGIGFAKWVDHKTKTQLGADKLLNAQLHAQLVDRIAVLELAGHAKDIEFHDLELRYSALKAQHEDLKEAYRASEEANRSLRDQLLVRYLNDRATLPPPPRLPSDMWKESEK